MQLKTPFPGFRPHVNLLTNDWLVTLATGENLPHAMVFAEGYIFVGLQTSPGKLIRIDPTDPENYDVVTFANDGAHNQVMDLLYIPAKAKIYALFSAGRVSVTEIDPTTLATTDVINDNTYPSSVGGGSFCFDSTYLYVLLFNTTPAAVIRYALSDFSRVSYIWVADEANEGAGYANYRFGHALRYDGTDIYATGTVVISPFPSWLRKIDPSTFTITQRANTANPVSITDDFCFTTDHIWLGTEQTGAVAVIRVAKSDISAQTLVPVSGKCYGTFFDGTYVLACLVGTPGKLARIDPGTLAVREYSFPSGQNDTNEFCQNGETVYFTFYSSPGKVSALDRSFYK